MITNGKRHKKGAKGKLVSKHFEPNDKLHFCLTCECRGEVREASQVRIDKYEFMTVNVYFCDEHAAAQQGTKSKYPLVDHMNRAYELGLFRLGEDGGPWGIRALASHNLNNVDGGYLSHAAALQGIALLPDYGLSTDVEVVKRIDGVWSNVW